MSPVAARVLSKLAEREPLLVCGTVYAELLAGPLRDESSLDSFFADTGIQIDWKFEEAAIRLAGRSYAIYADRRRKLGTEPPRRLLANFLIGAHAQICDYSLLTLDWKHFSSWFPDLDVIALSKENSMRE